MTRTASIIDGKAAAADLRAKAAAAAKLLKERRGIVAGLAVVLVGNDPASEIYVRNKGRETIAAGMASFEIRLPVDTSEAAILAEVRRLNADPAVHGILVQMPLPHGIDSDAVVRAILPEKDVDGLHPFNAGLLAHGKPRFVPCTPQGVMILLASALPRIAGLKALVVGRSILVGRPMGHLLLNADATVTLAHSRTENLSAEVAQADILIAAIGKAEFIRGDWIKKGAIVIDVGINRSDLPDGKRRLLGDVAFEEAAARAAAITPVPGGVGPMTISCLLRNTVVAAAQSAGLKAADIGL